MGYFGSVRFFPFLQMFIPALDRGIGDALRDASSSLFFTSPKCSEVMFKNNYCGQRARYIVSKWKHSNEEFHGPQKTRVFRKTGLFQIYVKISPRILLKSEMSNPFL